MKRIVAEALGLAFQATPPEEGVFPVAFHASGAPEGLAEALKAAAFEGRIIDLAWYGDTPVTLPLGEDFHDRRLTIQSSQVGHVAPSRRATWTHARRLDRAIGLLDDPRLDALFTSEGRLDDLPETMGALAEGRIATVCHRIVHD